jgi:predicted Rossmann fold nucleotide-binding protein DprA/Smf involved in DNA uptake
MSETDACRECLRRSWLLGLLGPYIERSTSDVPGLLALPDAELAAKVAPERAAELLAGIEAKSEDELGEELEAADCWAVCRHADRFPEALRETDDAPKALIGRGERGMLQELSANRVVAIVGSRRATSYGREVARSLGHELGSAGAVVVSGLAFGIDACAHRGALDAGAPNIAVLGCGPDVAYPTAHRSLSGRIAETGAVLSELPPGATPWRWTLVYRKLFGPIPIAGAGPHRPTVPALAALRDWDVRGSEDGGKVGKDP